jgi:hypothetical protein
VRVDDDLLLVVVYKFYVLVDDDLLLVVIYLLDYLHLFRFPAT